MANRQKVGEVEYKIGADIKDLEDGTRTARRRIGELDDEVRQAGETIQEFERRTGKASHAVRQVGDDANRAGRQVGDLGDEGRRVGSDFAEADASMDRFGDTTRRVGKEANDAFGDDSRRRIGDYAGAIAKIAGAAGIAQSALQRLREDAQRGLDGLGSTQTGDQALAQVAEDARDLEAMKLQADIVAEQFGLDRNDMRMLRFGARSDEFDDDFKLTARASQLLGSEATATVAGQFTKLFPEELSTEEALSGTLVAARSSRLNFQEIARGMPQAAETAAAQGTGASELMALMSVLPSSFKSGETAGDRLKALQARLSQLDEFRGKGVLQATAEIEEMTSGDSIRSIAAATGLSLDQAKALVMKERKTILGGSTEVTAGFDAVTRNRATIEERRQAIDADRFLARQGQGTLEKQLLIQESDQSFLAQRRQRQADVRVQRAKEEEGRRLALLQAAQEQRRMSSPFNYGMDVLLNAEVPVLGNVGLPNSIKEASDIVTGQFFRRDAQNALAAGARAQAGATSDQVDTLIELQRRTLEQMQRQSQPQVIDRVPD